MNYFESFDQEKIAYQIQNQPTEYKDTIVLVHGFGGDPNFLVPFIEELIALSPKKRVISYNLRGHGYSSMKFPKEAKSFEWIHAQDLQALLKYLKIEKPILIGHSLGGIVVQEYLLEKLSPKPKKIIFICTAIQLFGFEQIRKICFKILKKMPLSTAHVKERSVAFHRQFAKSYDIDIKRFIHDAQITGGLTHWLTMIGSLLGWKNRDLSSIDQKNCYYIYGNQDLIIPIFIQERKLKKMTQINKILISSNHISPITATQKLANVISGLI